MSRTFESFKQDSHRTGYCFHIQPVPSERHHSRVVTATGYGAESRQRVMSSRLGFAIRRLENLSLSTQQQMGTLFESRKDKVPKGAPPFICCAQNTVGF